MSIRTKASAAVFAIFGMVALAVVPGWSIPAAAQEPALGTPPVEPPAESWQTTPEPGGMTGAEASPAAPGTGLVGDSPNYEIGAADVVRVIVWRNPELSAEVPVRPDGRISVPLLGDIEAAGLTTAALRERISAGLSEYITAPDVTVIVAQVNSKVVFLVGEVVRPSAIPLNREMRVLDAIAMAGGFSPFADKGDIQVLRPQPDGSVERHEFDYGKFVKGKKPESNLLLRAGDTIVVPD